MPKRKNKKYNRPRKIYDAALIKEETDLINKYGLKNRREVWRAIFAIKRIRDLAKQLITSDEKSKEEFVNRQREKGFKVESIADILSLSKEDYLKRRLQSIVVSKGFAKTPKQARQMIVHKQIKLNGNFIDSPSHLTTLTEEAGIEATRTFKEKKEMSSEEKKFLENMKGKEDKE